MRGVWMMSLIAVLSLVAPVGCGASSPGTAGADSDAGGGRDAGTTVDVPTDVYVGPGSAMITWTINGMPPATGCAAVQAVSVDLHVFINSPVTVPCTDGQYMVTDLPAGTDSVSGELVDAMGHTIYQYSAPTVVHPNETATPVLAFAPPGTLTVSWTFGGQPATAALCMAQGIRAFQLDVGVGNPIMVNVAGPLNPYCANGSFRFQSVQPGDITVEATVIDTMDHFGGLFRGTGTVVTGTDAQVVIDVPAR